jgi:chromosome segregation protein
MRLKKLELLGFKSFCDKTVISFQPGITGIVGPNGCGKSNFVDAVLWATGEQRTTILRSEQMEDVIFNGSDSRKPLGMANVSLTFTDIQGELSQRFSEYQEITITRRLFRSGESEYFINKIPCRLKDIRDLLIDSGTGTKGHSIIEQGKVDALLNASPQERRGLIEETAGIAKYKARKTEALRKLEATQQNLVRVRDIIQEVKRQMNSLDRQAKRAEQYRQLQDQFQALEMRLWVVEYKALQGQMESGRREIEAVTDQEAELLARSAMEEAQLQEAKLSLFAQEQELTLLNQKVHELEAALSRNETKVELFSHQIQEWSEQKSRLGQELTETIQGERVCTQEIESLREQRRQVQDERKKNETALIEKESRAQTVIEAAARSQEALIAQRAVLLQMLSEATDLKNTIKVLESRQSESARQQEKNAAEARQLAVQIETAQTHLEGQTQRLEEIQRRIEADRQKIAELRQRHQELQEAARQMNESLALKQGALEMIERPHHSPWRPAGSIGRLNDFVEPESRYAKAITAALGQRLQAWIMEDYQTISEALILVRQGEAGRFSFIPKTVLQSPARSAQSPEGPPPGQAGVLGPAIQFVRCHPAHEPLISALLHEVYVVETLEAAVAIKRAGSSMTFVTLEGEVVDPNGVVSLDQLSLMMHQLAGEIEGLQQKQLEKNKEVEAVHHQISETEMILRAQELEEVQLKAEQSNLFQEIHRLQQSLQDRGIEREGIEQESREIWVSLDRAKAALVERLAQQATEGQRLTQLEQEGLQHRDTTAPLMEELTQLRLEAAKFKEREAHLETLSGHHQALLTDHRRAHIEKEETLKQLLAKSDRLAQELGSIQAELVQGGRSLQELKAERERRSNAHAERAKEISRLEAILASTRQVLDEHRQRLHALEMSQTELRMNLEHLVQRLASSYHRQMEALVQELGEFTLDLQEAQDQLQQLRLKLSEIGPVNLMAIEEYRGLEERHQFLTAQEADLTQSIETLQKVITQINRTTKKLFMESYQKLRQTFAEMFTAFFQGGKADLILLDEANPLESGLDIIAQPPGKRLRNISLLSGGEKALTAIALLFASFLIHPSPFCVLDEIDAQLDEENNRRFLTVLKRLTDRSQFILITHNKRTMEAAGALYGVTMGEPGVSKLVSVHLEKHPPAKTDSRVKDQPVLQS